MDNTNNMNTLSITSRSGYLASVLDPRARASSIPDEQLQRHMLKSCSVLANIPAPASGRGVFVLSPSHYGDYIGAHYSDNAGVFTYDRTLSVSDDLIPDFDYSRLVSRIVEINSSSISSTSFVLNGVVSAAKFDAELTEANVSDLDYESVCSLQGGIDKVESAPMHDGVTVLYLPDDFNAPFSRLREPATPSYLAAVPSSTTTYRQDGSRPAVTTNTSTYTIGATPANTSFIHTDYPVGTVSGVKIVGNIGYYCPAGSPAFETIIVEFSLIDLFGNIITSGSGGQTSMGFDNPTGSVNLNLPINAVINVPNRRPIKALRLRMFSDQALVAATFQVNLGIEAIDGSKPNVMAGSVVVAYTGMTSGSMINVSGRSNYELIPSAALARNVPMLYSPYDPNELTFVRVVMAHRAELGIRAVQRRTEYQSLLSRYRMIPSMLAPENEEALAADWKSIAGVIKKLIQPAGMAIKAFSPAIGRVADPFLQAIEDSLGEYENHAWAADSSNYTEHLKDLELQEPAKQWEVRNMPHRVVRKAVCFPVLIMDTSGQVPTPDRVEIYAAFPVSSSLTQPGPQGRTLNKVVYNYRGAMIPLSTPCNVGFAKVIGFSGRGYVLSNSCAPVTGHSCMVALGVLSELVRANHKSWSIVNLAFTGSFRREWKLPEGQIIEPNVMMGSKLQGAHALGFKLAGANDPADHLVHSVMDAVKLFLQYQKDSPDEAREVAEEKEYLNTVYAFAATSRERLAARLPEPPPKEEYDIEESLRTLAEDAANDPDERLGDIGAIIEYILDVDPVELKGFIRYILNPQAAVAGQKAGTGTSTDGLPRGVPFAKKKRLEMQFRPGARRGPTAEEAKAGDYSQLHVKFEKNKSPFDPEKALDSSLQQVFGTTYEKLPPVSKNKWDRIHARLLPTVVQAGAGLTQDAIVALRAKHNIVPVPKSKGKGISLAQLDLGAD